jgi:tape measure domain-containing protein
MAESYSVTAILGLRDNNFSKGMKNAMKNTESFGQKLKNGFAFGAFAGLGQKAIGVVENAIRSLTQEMNESTRAWDTFRGNMQMNGKTNKQIDKIQGSLQKFAQQTIYSASDMASTYAQLDAVGTKHTLSLVKGFGGLAAAAENPKQAMRTLSQQATQMAAKPMVQWQDFKLMLEQTPAGISKVAKYMGMSTQELIKNVQDGKVKTEDFLNAIAKVGTDKHFSKLATTYKTVGDAMDGLRETIANSLQPAFKELSQVGIDALSAIGDAIGKIDGQKIANGMKTFAANMRKYGEILKKAFSGVGEVWGKAFSKIGKELVKLSGSKGNLNLFSVAANIAAGAIKKLGEFCANHASAIAHIIDLLPKLIAAFIGFKVVNGISAKVKAIAGAFGKLKNAVAGSKGGAMGKALEETAQGTKKVGSAAGPSAGQLFGFAAAAVAVGVAVLLISNGFSTIASAAVRVSEAGPAAVAVMFGMIGAIAGLAVVMFQIGAATTATAPEMVAFGAAVALVGGGVFLAAAGMSLLAQAAINLASAGPGAAVAMVGLVAAIAALAVVFAVLGPLLTAGALGIAAFGVAVLAVGAGCYLASAGLSLVAQALPAIAQYGLSGAVAIAALGLSLVAFAAGALAAGVAGTAAGLGLAAFALACTAAAGGTLLLRAGLAGVKTELRAINNLAATAKGKLMSMVSAVNVVKAGLSGVASYASSAMARVKSAFTNAIGPARSAGRQIGSGFKSALSSSLSGAGRIARSARNAALNGLQGGYGAAWSSGHQIGAGLAAGMRSTLGAVAAAASALVKQADRAVKAKAVIRSPSHLLRKEGNMMGLGVVRGILDKIRAIRNAAREMVQVPNVSMGQSINGTIDKNTEYRQEIIVNANVTSELDGRAVGYGTAQYVQEKNDYDTQRLSRIRGALPSV